MEWAHAMAPGANIMLVEASSDQRHRPAGGRELRVAACQCRVDELGRRASSRARQTDDSSTLTCRASRSWPPRATAAPRRSGRRLRRTCWASAARTLTLDCEQRLVERDRLERQRRRPQRLRVAAVVPDRCGHPDSRRRGPPPTSPMTPSPSTGVAVYDSVPYEGTTLGWVEVWRHQRRGAAVVGAAGDRRPGPGRRRPVGAQHHRARSR